MLSDIRFTLLSISFLAFSACNFPSSSTSIDQSTSLGGSTSSCSGNEENGQASGFWAFAASEKGAQKIKTLAAFQLTQVELYMSAAGASAINLEIRGDGPDPGSGTLLASASISNPTSGYQFQKFTFATSPSLSANTSFYVVFWVSGAAPTYLTGDDTPIPGLGPFLGQMFELSTAWDNSGPGTTWESIGNYGMKARFGFSANGAACSH